jgi:3D (Asp-Asp-Asp) domain-containing protein
MSCYYTTSQQEWGAAPNSCGSTTISGTTYTGYVTNPPGLPAGSYCNAFLAQLRLQGSAVLTTGTDVQYNPGTGYYVVSAILGADGSPVVAGQTVARDRSIIPKTPTTYVDINTIGFGLLPNDTGGAILGYRIDYYGGAGAGVCSGFNNVMAVSGCSPSNGSCPGDTTIQ